MQFTITYRGRLGVKFAFITSDSKLNAKRQVLDMYQDTGVIILTVRENNPPLPIIEGRS